MPKQLFIVATPIGNLQDITIRAINVLFSVNCILSEQPQKTINLLKQISKNYPMLTQNKKIPNIILFNEYVENEKMFKILSDLETVNDVALVSEAGTPLISDPGYKLVRALKKERIIISIPGPSAVISSLAASGLPSDKFLSLGFLPKTKSKKQSLLFSLKELTEIGNQKKINPTIIFFESPHRINETLNLIWEIFGNISLVLVREQTKLFEEIIEESIQNLIAKFAKNPIRGEVTVLFRL